MSGQTKATDVGYLQLYGWGGRTQQAVVVEGHTPKRTRIRAIVLTKLAGRRRWLKPGATALVPKAAVRPSFVPGVELISFREREAT